MGLFFYLLYNIYYMLKICKAKSRPKLLTIMVASVIYYLALPIICATSYLLVDYVKYRFVMIATMSSDLLAVIFIQRQLYSKFSGFSQIMGDINNILPMTKND
jgi:hypothetical protein